MVSVLGCLTAGSVEDVQAIVKSFAGTERGILPIGGGVRTHIGHDAVKPLQEVSTLGLNGIVDYNPDDLVVVAEAGMTLAALQSELAKNGQWLPIDVAAPDRQTLGGIVASRSNSTLRAAYGSVRDWIVGVELVDASGAIVVGGGKVVKNVSGYDLSRLYCGSWGTLGILTKTNFKVAPLPEAAGALLIVLSNDRNAEDLLDRMLGQLHPASALLFNHHAAARVLGPEAAVAQYLFVRFLGMREDVQLLIERASADAHPFASSILSLPEEVATPLLRQLTDFTSLQAPLSATYHILSSQVGAHARMIDWIAAKYGLRAEVVADTACGIVAAHFHGDLHEEQWSAFLPVFQDKADRVGGSLVIETMPRSWRALGVPVWSPVLADFALMRSIKQALDPGNVFSPGRFIGGL